MVNSQEWLEQKHPNKVLTNIIHLNQQLEGVLDCQEYKNLRWIFISSSVDNSKLEVKKGSYRKGKYETEIIHCIPAQTYLDQEYPTQKEKQEAKSLYICGTGLERELDLSDFENLERLDCPYNFLTSLNLGNCKKLKRIDCFNNQLTTLNLSNLEQLERLRCYNNYLTQIVYPTNPKKITILDISNNNFSLFDLTIFSQFWVLENLYIGNTNKNRINQKIYNQFYGSLKVLKDLNKLEQLDISNTDIDSGWEYLPDGLLNFTYDTELRPNCKLAQTKVELEKELWKDIHKDFAPKYKKEWLDQGFNKNQTKKILKKWSQAKVRPQDRKFIDWFLNLKKLDLDWALENEEEFEDLRDKYGYFGTCEECQRTNTSYKWCQSCNAKHFRDEFSNWTSGNLQIDKFIQQCQLEATSPWNILEWMPYEKFRNIKYIAKGGFGKVEKAEWERGSIWNWDNEKKEWEKSGDFDGYDENAYQTNYKDYKTVALKTLSNSQNLSPEFLKELTLYKRFKSEVSKMVPCYGISQDREGNYIMVMDYMRGGDLREYLKRNYQKLDLRNKLFFLKDITQGLKDIHRKKLVHRDFHGGNIIVDESISGNECRITDLGLSKPVNEEEKEDTIYGLMPYVAPEVLRNQPYTQKSDIYSLGTIIYEIITGLLAFGNKNHDINLALQICQGIRPKFSEQVKCPHLLVDLITRCWDSEPNNRPTAEELSGIVGRWFKEVNLKKDTEFYRQYEEADDYNKILPEEIRCPAYQSQKILHSELINVKKISEKLMEISQSMSFSITELQEALEEIDRQEEKSDKKEQWQNQIQIPPKSP